jgi:hypothetical protein
MPHAYQHSRLPTGLTQTTDGIEKVDPGFVGRLHSLFGDLVPGMTAVRQPSAERDDGDLGPRIPKESVLHLA